MMQYRKVVATIPGVSHPDGSPHRDTFLALNSFSMVEGEMEFNNPPAMSSGGEFFYLAGSIKAPTAHRVYDTSGADFAVLRETIRKERRRIEDRLRKDIGFMFSLISPVIYED